MNENGDQPESFRKTVLSEDGGEDIFDDAEEYPDVADLEALLREDDFEDEGVLGGIRFWKKQPETYRVEIGERRQCPDPDQTTESSDLEGRNAGLHQRSEIPYSSSHRNSAATALEGKFQPEKSTTAPTVDMHTSRVLTTDRKKNSSHLRCHEDAIGIRQGLQKKGQNLPV